MSPNAGARDAPGLQTQPTYSTKEPPVTGLDHYLIRVRDLERSKDFYVGVLGIEIMPRVKTTRE